MPARARPNSLLPPRSYAKMKVKGTRNRPGTPIASGGTEATVPIARRLIRRRKPLRDSAVGVQIVGSTPLHTPSGFEASSSCSPSVSFGSLLLNESFPLRGTGVLPLFSAQPVGLQLQVHFQNSGRRNIDLLLGHSSKMMQGSPVKRVVRIKTGYEHHRVQQQQLVPTLIFRGFSLVFGKIDGLKG